MCYETARGSDRVNVTYKTLATASSSVPSVAVTIIQRSTHFMKLTTTRFPTIHRMKYIRLLLLVLWGLMLMPTAAAQKQSQTESRFATLDGARIHYQNYGKGREALVLIHGWTCSIEYWRDLIPDPSKRSRVIAIDLPGHGQSDKPPVAYTMYMFAP